MSVPTGFDQWIDNAHDAGSKGLERRLRIERRMARALVNTCIERGFLVSVNDGEEITVRRSTVRSEIMAALASTDGDILIIHRDGEKVAIGWFSLIYGNDGTDVVSDYADNEVCNAIWSEVINPLAQQIDNGEVRP